MRKTFELSEETVRVLAVFQGMTIGQEMTFAQLKNLVKFPVSSSSGSYTGARKVAERDHGIYIGAIRGAGFFRGRGEDMANSLEPMAARMRRIAKRSVSRADLAISNNLPEDVYKRVSERRTRASIIYSTTSAPLAASNKATAPVSQEAPAVDRTMSLRRVR